MCRLAGNNVALKSSVAKNLRFEIPPKNLIFKTKAMKLGQVKKAEEETFFIIMSCQRNNITIC